MTLHRPSNVDDPAIFNEIVSALNDIAETWPIFFPVHPRTRKNIDEMGIHLSKNIFLLPPLSFTESLYLWKDSRVVLTDSGGLQEETTALGVPCGVTIRENTERPITVEIGTNVLAGTRKENVLRACEQSIEKARTARMTDLWDGQAAERIWRKLGNG